MIKVFQKITQCGHFIKLCLTLIDEL